MLCQVPRASRPPRTGTVAWGGTIAGITWDRPWPGEWTARLSDGTRMWWSDGRSYALRLEMATAAGLHGVALWRLGSADPLP